tara:strand:+ start:122 stop:532 length:411 start_codon:yes stop_codon:yes gene_type:complete
MAKRYFTLLEAQSLVPWLNNAFGSIRNYLSKNQVSKKLLEEQVNKLRSNGNSQTEENVQRMENESTNVKKDIDKILTEINDEGILIKRIDTALVDFPHLLEDGKEIYLCWMQGEQEIEFWHEIETGFPGRRPINEL